jgi:signal transduction histidine kinase
MRNLPRQVHTGVSICFYRILQEALQNVAKHSGATRVQVRLSACENQLVLYIKDNGKGFDTDKVMVQAGLGIISMRERMHLIGGQITIHSKRQHGTEISASAALSPPAAL